MHDFSSGGITINRVEGKGILNDDAAERIVYTLHTKPIEYWNREYGLFKWKNLNEY